MRRRFELRSSCRVRESRERARRLRNFFSSSSMKSSPVRRARSASPPSRMRASVASAAAHASGFPEMRRRVNRRAAVLAPRRHHLARSDARGNRKPTAERLADAHEVREHALAHRHQHASASAETRPISSTRAARPRDRTSRARAQEKAAAARRTRPARKSARRERLRFAPEIKAFCMRTMTLIRSSSSEGTART